MPTGKLWRIVLWVLLSLAIFNTVLGLILTHYSDALRHSGTAVLIGMCLGYIRELREAAAG